MTSPPLSGMGAIVPCPAACHTLRFGPHSPLPHEITESTLVLWGKFSETGSGSGRRFSQWNSPLQSSVTLGNWRVLTLSEEPTPFIWPAPLPSHSLISLWPYGITGSEKAYFQPAFASLQLDEVAVSHLWAALGVLIARLILQIS